MLTRGILSFLLTCIVGAGMNGDSSPLGKWSNGVIPLPKEIQVAGSRSVPPADVVLVLPKLKNPMLSTAAKVLGPLATGSKGFELRLALTTEGSSCPAEVRASLDRLPNRDQAYAIRPILRGGKFQGLLLAARTPLGLLYAARTLAEIVLAPSAPGSRLGFPRLTLRDWPDLEERGEWFGGTNHPDYDWMAERKFNVVQVQPVLGFRPDGSPQVDLDQQELDKARAAGIQIVPIIWHVEQLATTGVFRYHPEVASIPEPGKHLPPDYQPGMCFSQPMTIQVLSGWMNEMLARGLKEIMVWVSEDASPCYCSLCKGREPYWSEVKGIQEAFEKVRQGRKDLTLQILTTQGSYTVNDRILAAASPDTRIVYYDGGRTYDSSRRPMIYPLMANFSQSGHWLGVYPQLTNSWRVVFPFTGPQLIQTRMQEFMEKRLRCMIGYATPSNRYYDFNVTAAAEWTWNSRGRSPHDFAEVWAQRAGISHPQRFGDWADLIGEAGWDVAGGRVVERLILPESAIFQDAPGGTAHTAANLRELRFGEGLLSEIPDRAALEARLSSADRALELAKAEGDKPMLQESQSVIGALHLVDGLLALSGTRGMSGDDQRSTVQSALTRVDAAAQTLAISLDQWGAAVNPATRSSLPSRLRDTVDFAPAVAGLAWEAGRALGIRDPYPAYRLRPVREWKTSDFAADGHATLWAEVTPFVDGPGEYDVRFQFLDGDVGLDTHAVAALRTRGVQGEQPLNEDRWNAHADPPVWVDYWLTISDGNGTSWRAGDPLFLRLDVSIPPEAQKRKQTTHGVILICKSWRGQSEAALAGNSNPSR